MAMTDNFQKLTGSCHTPPKKKLPIPAFGIGSHKQSMHASDLKYRL